MVKLIPKEPKEPVVEVPNLGKNKLRETLSFIMVIALAIVFAFVIITFVFRSYDVDGPSMESTLQNQDKLVIWKVPRTWSILTGNQYVPKRGDIIVFNQPDLSACGQTTGKLLIKRVIGLPGNKVVINSGIVTLYDSNHPNGYQPDQVLSYNKNHVIQNTTPDETVQLNPHQLFVLGDNRPVSCDSRYFGPINTNQVVGNLVLRILPLGKVKTF